MEGFSIWHWLIVLVVLFFLGYPIARIIRRTGYSAWWVIFFFLPITNLIGLWVLAFIRWPSIEGGRPTLR